MPAFSGVTSNLGNPDAPSFCNAALAAACFACIACNAAGDTAGAVDTAGAGAVSVSGNKDSCSPALGALGACGSIKPGNPAGAFGLAGLSALRLDGLKESGPGRNGGKKLSVWPNFCACNSPTSVRG